MGTCLLGENQALHSTTGAILQCFTVDTKLSLVVMLLASLLVRVLVARSGLHLGACKYIVIARICCYLGQALCLVKA